MEREDYRFQRDLTGIHINLEEQAIEFEDRHGTIGRLVFGQEVVLYEGHPLLLTPARDPQRSTETGDQPNHAEQQPRPPRAPRPAYRPPPPNPRSES